MPEGKLSKTVQRQINEAVQYFVSKVGEFRRLATTLRDDLAENGALRPLIHSTRFRVKDPKHLSDKLGRIALSQANEGTKFNICVDNLFSTINDLAGVRLLHLHTSQMSDIDPAIRSILDEHRYRLVGKPVAYTWDIENESFFKIMGFKTRRDELLYTSVHYVVEPNRRTKMRCELQVRTLVEEVWGEVSHTINYPHETTSVACSEQLKVLARIASGCTRLVDSIFVSHREHEKSEKKQTAPETT